MWWFNVHRVPAAAMERVINDHIAKGYDLHFIRNAGQQGPKENQQGSVQLVFKREVTDPDAWKIKYAKRYGKKENGEGQTLQKHPPLPVESQS